MANIIHRLSDAVANQIAAGEVIQRPASVVKELMENAVDAGASGIDVAVTDAGRSLIRVSDDGKGMSADDARLAFEKHATSKIQNIEDLFSLRTMGFRGEALPSIASVAQVALQTKTVENEVGLRLEIEGGNFTSEESAVCATGTCFEVKNLFFNIPARRKFLKSNHTELTNIIQEFERVALVNHSVNFSFNSDGTDVLRLTAASQKKRIADIFGKKLGEDLLEVVADTTLVHITGFVGRPESAHKKNVKQFFFVNGRFMRHAYFNKAVQVAFEGMIPADEQVPYFLFFDTDPANIDVNISPTKTEVKFENEPAVWNIIVAAVRESLGKFQGVQNIDFDNATNVEIPVFTPRTDSGYHPQVNVDSTYNPFRSQTSSSTTFKPQEIQYISSRKPVPTGWGKLYDDLDSEMSTDSGKVQEEVLFSMYSLGSTRFQYKGQYIMAASDSGLTIINQRRAHIRVLFEKYQHQMQHTHAPSQGLLFPELLELSASDAIIMEGIIDDIRHLGFDIVSLGNGSYSINGLPEDFGGIPPQKILQEIVGSVRDGGTATGDFRSKIALSMARSSAIVAGQVLSDVEMSNLVSDLFHTQNPNFTPDGKRIIAVLSDGSLEQMFG